jgi:hypothetical protein
MRTDRSVLHIGRQIFENGDHALTKAEEEKRWLGVAP